MSEHEELESSVAAWVLGALDADEAESVRVHVEGCPGCREATIRLRRVIAALPLEVEEVTPPARLRERVLSAASTSRSAPAAPTAARATVRPRLVRRPLLVRVTGRVPAYAVAAAAVVALAVGVVAGDLLPRSAPVVSSPVARFSLAGHQAMAGAGATVIDLKNDGIVLVDFRALPPLQAGKVYEVWLVTPSNRADPAAVFVPDSNGGKVVLVNRSLSGYSVMAVTAEVGPNGTEAPTQPPQLYGSIADTQQQ
jgi:anti-sigma-K factor RskA